MRKNWFIYGIVLVILFGFIYLRDSSVTYRAFYAALILPLFSYGLAVLTKRNIRFTETLSTNFIAKHEKIEYQVQIQNHGFLPCFLIQIKMDLKHLGLDSSLGDVYLNLAPWRGRTITAQISGAYRGIYEVGCGEVVLYDFLGLFKVRPKYASQIRLTIAPRIIALPDLMMEMNSDGETTTRRNLPGTDLSVATELRDYLPTDSYRQIHWKATAKKGKLISKNPQEVIQPQSVFLIDNRRLPKSLIKMLITEDQLIDTAVSVISHCHNLGHQLAVQTLRAKFLQSASEHSLAFTTDFNRLYHEVAALPFGEFGELTHMLAECCHSGTDLDNIFVFTQDVNDDVLEAIQNLRMLNNQVTLFMFGTLTKGTQRRLEMIGVEVVFTKRGEET